MNNNIDIRASDLLIVQTILQKIMPKNTDMWVFGSRVKGTTKRSSDLDLAIDAGRSLIKAESSALFHAFEESDLPYKVDVVDIHSVNETLKKIIDKEKVPLPIL